MKYCLERYLMYYKEKKEEVEGKGVKSDLLESHSCEIYNASCHGKGSAIIKPVHLY